MDKKDLFFLDTSDIDISSSYVRKKISKPHQSTKSELCHNSAEPSCFAGINDATQPTESLIVRYKQVENGCKKEVFTDPAQAFFFFFNNDVVSYVLNQTNKKIKNTNPNNTEKANSFVDITDLKTFIGIMIFFSLNKAKNIMEVWNENSVLFNSFIKSVMPLRRFKFIYSKFTLFSKKDKENNYIKKKPKIVLKLIKLFKDAFDPSENISLDETIVGFKGRVLNRVYSPLKPSKFGIKLYSMCDSETSYLLDMQIVGEKNSLNEMILEFVEDYGGRNRILHMDNYYNSVGLSRTLLEKKIHTNGTIKKNRGISNVIYNNIPEKNNYNHTILDGNIFFYNYMDNKQVPFISTVYKDEFVLKTGKEWKKNKNNGKKSSRTIQKKIPLAIDEYNKHMNGVDKYNQSVNYLDIKRKSKKWDRKLSLFLIEVILHNAYILWMDPSIKEKRRYKFKEFLTRNLLSFKIEKKIPHCCEINTKRGRCAYCYQEGVRSETNHYCAQCQKFIHAGDCFRNWHTDKQYLSK